MALAAGSRLGPYEVQSALGAGGMGEVYKARDTRLERTVAIKVLPPALAGDPEFRARFDREAKSISALNHPHICTLHDVGETDGTAYLVMEHLEGETLAERLKKGALPVDQVLDIASQMADALDKAHRRGIIHRDLKPANVFLVRGASASATLLAKLLDFGLAKVGAAAPAGAIETRLLTTPPPVGQTTPLTSQGSILGTFQYMAPEQVEGHEADARTDIWAFGCVLYEMLTGRRAFEARSQASLIASVLERQPTPISELQPLTPPALGRVVRTCLEKHPDHRFHTAHDLWLQLQWIEEGGSAAGLPAPVVAGRKRRHLALFAGAAILLALLAAAGAWALKPAPAIANVVTRFVHPLPASQNITRGGRKVVAISPDGTKLAYVANNQIYLRHMHEIDAQPIRGTDIDPLEPMFSPDGQSVAFFAPVAGAGSLEGALLKKVPIVGGAAVTLCPAGPMFGARWQGDRIVFSLGDRILSVADTGGAPQTLVELPKGSSDILAHPQLLDNGRALLYAIRAGTASFNDAKIVVQPLPSGTARVLVEGGTDPRVTDSGHLVWIRENILTAQPFDSGSLQLKGGPVPIVESVRDTPASGAGQYSLSENGTLVYVMGAFEARANLLWVDRQGVETPTGIPPALYSYPRLSPDGTKIVVNTTQLGDNDIWLWDNARKTTTRLTQGPEFDSYPVWSRDSRSIFYASGATNVGPADLYRRAADGTGTLERLIERPTERATSMMILSDDRILIRSSSATGQSRLMVLPPSPGAKPEPVFPASLPSQTNGEVSPNGRWIAYQSSEGSTRDEIHVRPFPATDSGHWQISSGGGTRPMWSNSGRELFFVTGTPARLMRVAIETRGPNEPFTYGTPAQLLDLTKYVIGAIGRAFHISLDDQRFLMISRISAEGGDRTSIMVVNHWLEELNARVRAK
jgi:Tol biopolymer transport system component